MKYAEKLEAIKLRKKGFSYSEISLKLDVSKSTVSLWLRDIELTSKQKDLIASKHRAASLVSGMVNRKIWEDRRKELKELYDPPLHEPEFVLGLGLYWGEGSKYNSSDVRFSNADSEMILKFIGWIEKYFKGSKFRVRVQHHYPNKDLEIKNWWADTLSLPKNKFDKSSFVISKASKGKRNTLLHGTATIRLIGNGTWKVRQKIEKSLECIKMAW